MDDYPSLCSPSNADCGRYWRHQYVQNWLALSPPSDMFDVVVLNDIGHCQAQHLRRKESSWTSMLAKAKRQEPFVDVNAKTLFACFGSILPGACRLR